MEYKAEQEMRVHEKQKLLIFGFHSIISELLVVIILIDVSIKHYIY
jgi:hypothetical protein